MEEKKVMECHCDNCGNEANMTVTCKLVDVKEPTGVKVKKQLETRVCSVCGNEANLIYDYEG